MSSSEAEKSESDGLRAHRLLDTVNRLKEVRRRYVLDSGEGEKSALIEDRLDSIISDLDGSLKPGGQPVDIGSLNLLLAAVGEMIEAVGFPGYARVVASIREGLKDPAEDSTGEEEPPPPQRYEPPATSLAERAVDDAEVDEREVRAAAQGSRRGSRWAIVSVLIVGGVAAAVLLLNPGSETEPPAEVRTERVSAKLPQLIGPTAVLTPTPVPDPPELEETVEFRAESPDQFAIEVDLAHRALFYDDLDLALKRFAAAAAIDRHHHHLTELAEALIDALLKDADTAFDNSEWTRATERVEDARRIARGLYLDTTAIDHAAQKLADMTRFEDVAPRDQGAFDAAVEHSVRVTLTNGDVFFGRLEAIEDGSIVLEVHTGVEGGGVQFLKTIPLSMIGELRIFEAERPSETFVGR